MMIKFLDWDSEFFGLRIGRVDIVSSEELNALSEDEQSLRQQFDLLYVFAPQSLHWTQSDAVLVDEKMVYVKSVAVRPLSPSVGIYRGAVPNEDLCRLALVSGEYSRYRLDSRFPYGSYERLYSRWIEQAVIGNMADKVFIYQDSNHINGMLTLQWNVHKADIGLVAVDANVQRQGIGSKMIQTVETYLVQNTQVQILRVATQRKNTKACCLYEKNGFTTESITKVYHWWLHDGNH